MTVLLGALFAAGILLAVSPWVWPLRPPSESPRSDGALVRLLQSAGLGNLTPSVFLALSAALAVAAAAVAWLIIPVVAITILAAVLGGSAPTLWVRARRSRLLKTRRGLWSDVCDLLIASVRAGMSLPDSVAALSTTAPAPLRPAFTGFARDLAASGHFDSAVLRLKDVLADPVADRIIETLRMARQVGGTELPTLLRALSASVRAEAALRAEVEARQSWTRGAAVLGVAAPWVILALLALRPEGARAYSTPEGLALIVGGALISFVAYRTMLRIGRLPEPRRWSS